ncbi:MAG TPA: MFS transporter [Ramlibacter sp.]|nr:MFS transporter [Ramlibacter sp.]
MNRNLGLLTLCQGLFLTNNVTFIAINGLVGFALAPFGWMATLPVMAYVAGSALSTGIVSQTQQRFGRRRSFQGGTVIALASALLCAAAAATRNFWLLCFATVVAGYYNANANLYRFAAAEIAGDTAPEKAVSWVMAGGLFGAVVGPNLAARTRNLFQVPFVGAYLSLAFVAVLGFLALSFIDFAPPQVQQAAAGGRPLRQIMRQPVFIVAAAAGAFSYGVMNLLMAATPIAMQQYSLPFSDAALVLQWHVIGMFAPGFFTGNLIKRFGTLPVMALGVVLLLVCIAVALYGVELRHFLIALFTLGVGWNFVFTGSTTLSLTAYTPQERDRAQGALNFFVFATLAVSSFSSGVLVTTQGWQLLNYGSLVPVALTVAALVWLALNLRSERRATASAKRAAQAQAR